MVQVDRDLQAIQEVRDLLRKAKEAQEKFKSFTQEQVDRIVLAMAKAGYDAAEPLARLAVEETGYGRVEDKVLKNIFATRDVYNAIKDLKTVGIIREDRDRKLFEVAEPMGVVAAIIPTTNPTSTVMFKILISLKCRNGIVISPHPHAVKCIGEATRILKETAEREGAPKDLIGCLSNPTLEASQELMKHRDTAVILATGGAGLVRAAYSAGKPAFGVGPGNVPAYVDRSANVKKAVSDILAGKTFDWGTLCSAEQSVIADAPVSEEVIKELKIQRAYLLSKDQTAKVEKVLIVREPRLGINPELVGHSPMAIAERAGFQVPPDTVALVALVEGVGRDYPLSMEKLSPVLTFYTVGGWEEGIERCNQVLSFGGLGHTMAVHCSDERIIREFGLRCLASRIVINSPATHGSVGYTTELEPSMTLGCGTFGNNITTDNITARHLLNIKRVAYETKPLAVIGTPKDWKVIERGRGGRRAMDAPYHKALAESVSRKGGRQEQSPVLGAGERKYGTSGLTEEQVERIVEEFTKGRK